MPPTLRKSFLLVHQWAGLTAGLLLLVVAVSGVMLEWRPQLDRKVSARLYTVAPAAARLAPDDLVRRAQAVHLGTLESIRYSGDPTQPFQVYFSDKTYVHLNPYTGEVLGLRKRYGDFFGWFEGIHKFLQLDPAVGEPITGGTALVFGGIICTGLVLWWPASRRALKAGLTVNRKLSGRPWYLNLHKTIAIYASAVVLASVLSGAPVALDWIKDLLYPLTGSIKAVPPVQPQAGAAFAGFTAMTEQLNRRVPAAAEYYISLPKNGVVSSYAVAADAPHPNARSYLWLNPPNAAVIRFMPYAEASTGFRLYFWLLSFHKGLIGGWGVQLVQFLGALAVPVLGWTGAASYFKRKRARAPVTKSLVKV